MGSLGILLDWLKYRLQLIEMDSLVDRLRHRHLRKRYVEKLLRQKFRFSKYRAVYWARFIP